MHYRVLCLIYTSFKGDEVKATKGAPAPGTPQYTFLLKYREEKRTDMAEAMGFVTESLFAIGVEHLNTENIAKELSAALQTGGHEIIGFTNLHTTIVNDKITARTAIAAVQVKDQSFKERLPHQNMYIWLPWEEATKWYFDKKCAQLVYQAMKNLMDFKILPLRCLGEEKVTMDILYKNIVGSLSERQKAMLNAAQFGQVHIFRLHEIFMELVFPNSMMTYEIFEKFISAQGMRHGDDYRSLFRALNICKDVGITFHDFLFGIAAIQTFTQHGKATGDLRTRYIFRYFCYDCDTKGGTLKPAELQTLFQQIEVTSRQRPNSAKDIDEIMHMAPLTIYGFLKLAGTLKLRGFSCLLRMKKNLVVELANTDGTIQQKTTADRTVDQRTDGQATQEYPGAPHEKLERTQQREPNMTAPNVPTETMSSNQLHKKGKIAPSRRRRSNSSHYMEQPQAPPNSSNTNLTLMPRTFSPQEKKHADRNDHDEELAVCPYVLRTSLSGTCVNESILTDNAKEMSEGSKADVVSNAMGQTYQTFVYNKAEPRMVEKACAFIASIQYFCKRQEDGKKAYSWGNCNRKQVMRQFVDVCNFASTVLFNEDRCLKLNGSLRMFSDLHGKLDDLRQFERCFFPLGIDAVNSQFLFLGNNISKGNQAFEVIGYLLALKVLFPHKVWLIRGTEEFRRILFEEGFIRDTVIKFPDAVMSEVVMSLTRAFDNMPLCAIVNKKIFCSIGGIPHPDTYKDMHFTEQIQLYPKLLSDQVNIHALPVQIIFNEYVNYASNEALIFDEHGFAQTQRRFVYTEDALLKFLQNIGCTHFVRGGKMLAHGIGMQCSGKMLSIFSSSYFMNQKNEASCLIVNYSKCRVFTVSRNPR